MSRIVSAVVLVLGALLCAGGAASAAATQALAIDLRTDQPRIDHLERYTAGQPIAVRVWAQPAQGVVVLGQAPDGTDLRAPLARGADGTFAGSVTLDAVGTWKLAVATTVNGTDTATQTISLDVVEATSPLWITAMCVLAVGSIGAGFGLIVAGRRSAAGASPARA
jgi:hypothetical protein